MAVFYPSCRVRLQIRLDEGTDTGPLERSLLGGSPPQTAAPATPAQATEQSLTAELTNVQATLGALIKQRNDLSPEQYRYFRADLERQRADLQRRIAQGGGTTQQRPEAVDGAAPDTGRVVLGQILPEAAQINRNGIRTADTAQITINHADAPIDPRIVRACAVEVVLGTVEAQDYADGIRGGTRQEDGSLRSLVERPAPGVVLQSATRFVGWVDEWEIDIDGSGGDTVVLQCRDMSALLIDTPLPTGDTIDLSVPIEQGIQALLDTVPTTRGIMVAYGDVGEDAGTGPIPGRAVPAAAKARRGRVSRRKRSGSHQMSLWDHITDVAVGVGLVPVFRGYELRIINPRTFYAGRQTARQLVYGRHLQSLKLARKLGGMKVPTIEVRSYDPDIGRTRWARYPVKAAQRASGVFGISNPPRPTRASEVTASGSSDDRIQTFTVHGVNDSRQLERVARNTFEQIGRQEVEGEFATEDITSENGTPGDLLSLDAGDPVEVLIAAPTEERHGEAPTTTTYQQLVAQSQDRRRRYLQGLGFSEDTAAALAAAQETVAFLTTFRAQNVQIDWAADSGVSIKGDFINFVVVREITDVREEQEEPSPEVAALTRGRSGAEARELERISGVRRLLTTLRDGGAISDENYQERIQELQEVERRRVREIRES